MKLPHAKSWMAPGLGGHRVVAPLEDDVMVRGDHSDQVGLARAATGRGFRQQRSSRSKRSTGGDVGWKKGTPKSGKRNGWRCLDEKDSERAVRERSSAMPWERE